MITFKKPVFLIIFCLILSSALAQGFEDDVNDVPLDGGLSLLIAAGVGYGAKKMHAHWKKKNSEID